MKSCVPEYNKLPAAGQWKQDLNVMRLGTGTDQQVTGEQYLKLMERYTMIWTVVDLIGSLCQHLAIDTHTPPFQVIEIMEKHLYKDIWHHIEASDARWDHFRSVLKHLPASLLAVLLLLPLVPDLHLPIYKLYQEGDGLKWSDCSFINLTMCKNIKILPICLQQLYHTRVEEEV